jgi:glutaminyl-peptide cyclotransferase
VKINIESTHNKIVYGDDIKVDISVKLKDGELKQTNIYLDSILLTSNENEDFTYTISKFNRLGKHTLKVQSVKTDEIEGIYYKTFEVFSNINPEKYTYEVVNSFPHDTASYTEGFEIHKDWLYEGTGQNGKSKLMKTNLKTGKVNQSVKLADKYFGEGITIFDGRIYQLTYKSKIGFVYDLNNMTKIDSFYFESNEGWGMTHDDQHVIMSDGTNVLTYLDPYTYKPVKRLQVYDNNNAMVYLNELEYSDGYIYANVWTTFLIVKIDSQTGKIVSKIDLDGILTMTKTENPVEYLNGIAIDAASKKMYITGKLYPKVFEIKLVKKE